MANPMRSWWRLAQTAGEIGWYAPMVVQQRIARMAAAPLSTRPADRREVNRMVTEKLQAGTEAQWALWVHSLTLPQRAWMEFWSASLAGRHGSTFGAAAAGRAARDANLLARRVLLPAHRRVKANAKRLSGRR